MDYLKVSWRTAWRPWKCHGGEIWSDKIPKASLILANFSLNDHDKLRPKTVAFLKRKYSELWSSCPRFFCLLPHQAIQRDYKDNGAWIFFKTETCCFNTGLFLTNSSSEIAKIIPFTSSIVRV